MKMRSLLATRTARSYIIVSLLAGLVAIYWVYRISSRVNPLYAHFQLEIGHNLTGVAPETGIRKTEYHPLIVADFWVPEGNDVMVHSISREGVPVTLTFSRLQIKPDYASAGGWGFDAAAKIGYRLGPKNSHSRDLTTFANWPFHNERPPASPAIFKVGVRGEKLPSGGFDFPSKGDRPPVSFQQTMAISLLETYSRSQLLSLGKDRVIYVPEKIASSLSFDKGN